MEGENMAIDLKQALLDPTSVFDCPEDVVATGAIDRDVKVEILRRWGYDALELEVAEEENMPGEEPDLLPRIVEALRSLGADPDNLHRPPTKQGGI